MVFHGRRVAAFGEASVSFVVRWSRWALDVLAEAWLAHPEQRAEITQAAAAIDRLLCFDPAHQGESRDHDRRILFVPPLVAIFKIDDDHGVVHILNIRRLRPRGRT